MEWCASEDAKLWTVMDCEIPHRLERGTKHFFYKGVETSPYKTRCKTVRLMTIRNRPKRSISTSGGCNGPKWTISVSSGHNELMRTISMPILSLPIRRVVKLWDWWRYVTSQSGQYLLAVGVMGQSGPYLLAVGIMGKRGQYLCLSYLSL